MLVIPHKNGLTKPANQQKGLVLIIALIMLVAMTIAGIALVRSVDTTNIIAGNLAFQQAATQAGDIGSESAIASLQTKKNSAIASLYSDNLSGGYAASRQDPAAGTSWDTFWNSVTVSNGIYSAALVPQVVADGTSGSSGNTISYIIQRLCTTAGNPFDTTIATGCAIPPPQESSDQGNSGGAGTKILVNTNQQYYRITTRIAGPRNTVSYTQTIVAM